MTKPFKGIVNLDIRDSTPDWEPYEQPKAPDGAPNVLYIVWDDVGFAAMEPFAPGMFSIMRGCPSARCSTGADGRTEASTPNPAG